MMGTPLPKTKPLKYKPQIVLKTVHTDVEHTIHVLIQLNQTMSKSYFVYVLTIKPRMSLFIGPCTDCHDDHEISVCHYLWYLEGTFPVPQIKIIRNILLII